MNSQTEWIAVDWGTSNLRAWVFGPDHQLIANVSSDDGMGQLAPDQFEPALLALIGEYLASDVQTPVICCGMVGARQGWVEAPYAPTPCKPAGIARAVRPLVNDNRLDVHVLPGVSQAKPSDVMRGEETQIAGFLARFPDFGGVVCLAGTHTKWAHISAGEIVSFQTFMTGELFSLLSRQSVLRHSLGDDGWDGDAFEDAVNDAMSFPAKVSARLFSLRAAALLQGNSPSGTRASLSGLLIGLELAGARALWLGQDVVIAGPEELSERYKSALELQGLLPLLVPGEGLTLAGLAAAYNQLKDGKE